MNSLPAIDLGLMSEHLLAHDGVIHKLVYYQNLVTSTELQNILKLQEEVMRTHVWIMLAFINPSYHYDIEVPQLSTFEQKYNFQRAGNDENNKWVALESHSTAKNMSIENYQSAMLMKNMNVKNAHIEMALQQNQIKEKYANYIKKMGWDFVPKATTEAQISTFLHFNYLLNRHLI
ncbi:hypothetical protein [Gracilibacillus dipsosauri]|uniref:hypothetical protein n=1 Tax=Gracilibacillus dipsosauri TaxID=178340 RepID=UPI00240A584B